MTRHWLPADRRALAPVAAAERDARAKAYPAMIERRQLAQAEAEADFQAWAAIADWCQGGAVPGWADMAAMIAAARAGLNRREAALAKAPAEQRAELTARRDAGQRILAMLNAAQASCARITSAVRADLTADRKAEAA